MKKLLLILLLATLSPWAAQAQTKTHIANTSSDTQMTWDEFAQVVNNGTTYWGMTVYLDEDITATTMVGTQDNPFWGTFEGNGKTITLSGGEFGTSSSYASQEGVSPFYWIRNNARIKNLHIAGNIYSSNKHAAGFCYATEGKCTIYNCRSSVIINSTAETEAGCGFVAQPRWGYTNVGITIEGCVFDGAIIGSGSQCGGFVNYPNKAVNITNCLFAPSDMTIGASGSYMFHQINGSATVTLTNCYYSTPWGATAQGKKAYTITGQSPATVAMNGTATNYNVSHITVYSGTPGLVYNGTIIAGAGDQVSLNLESNYDYLYAVDHGTLTGTTNPYTLTMDAYNTTITGFSSVPYADDFESPCDWQFLNGDRINQWCYGIAASNGTGTHGLYISNDGGTTNAYTDVGTAYASGLGDTYLTTVYAAKMLHFEEGAYNITFDWRALGYLDYDYMRVALVPASVNLEAGAYLPAGFSNNTLPEGWMALDGGQKLNQSAEWQTHSSEFWVPASGNYKVVFAWRNSVWNGDQPPAAIDNVSVTAITCSTPFNLVATNINATVADLNWNGSPDVDSYTLMYRTAEDIGAQFKEDFESEVSFANWQAFGSSNTGNNFGRRTAAARTGSYGFSFSSRFQAAQYSQYLISPELSATGDLEFYFRASENNSRETFEVGYSSTGNNVDDFAWGQRYSSTYNSYWRHFQETIPEGTKYIAIHYTAQYQYELYIDDLTIGAYEVQAGEWQTTTVEGGSLDMGVTLSGLTPETLYEIYVYPDCNPDKQSEVSKFKTREICPVPTNLTVGNYTPNSADLCWTAVIEVENYTVKYRTISNGEWQTLSVAGNAAEACITLTGLTQGTTYEAQVKSDCSDPEKWSETVWFTVPILCDVPTALSTTPMLESATLTWEGDQEGYNVQYRPVAQGQAEWIERQVTETTLDITGLDSGTTYEWRVQGINLVCENGVTDWSETVTFRTVETFYDTDFENDCDWTLVNGDCTNQWCWGTAAHNGGTHGLYISNDGGTTNAYNNGATMVFAYKTLDFEAGVYRFSYDWLAYGDNYYDYLRVALVPASVSLVPGDALPSGFSYNTLPGGWIALDGRSQLNRATEWQTESNDILMSDAGSYMMVFAWRNDNSYNRNPPAAIDNVIIMQVTCPTPIDLAADNITYTTAELNWNSLTDMDGYLVRYRIDVSVNEGFENEDSFADWQAFGMDDANTGDGFGRSIYAAKNGLYGFSFTSVHETSDYNQYLISPQVSGNTDLEFYYRPYTSYSVETFRVGYSSTGNEVDDFVWGEEYSTSTSSNSWIRFHETIPGGTKYIAINYYSEYKGYLYIDDITIVNRGGEWQTATSATNSVTLTGLTLGTRYEVQVKSDCDEGKWSEAIFFATKPPVTKEIVGYGEGNANWYLIALPFAGETNPYMVDNIIGNTYDLYRFNPSHEDEEWENFENGFFWLVNGQGYLYANSEDVTFTFLAPDTDTETVEVPLAYDADDEHKCWNLVGNPFNCKAYLNKDYYILNDEGTGINPDAVSSSTPIPPCTAVFVKATSAEDKAVFMKHKYVDLGLPSGLLWATFNIGADTPEEYGDYFAWGETTPKNIYKWNNYKYCNGTYNTLTKYCGNSTYGYQGYSDNLTTLLPEDDAATANWGNDWRMPTDEEFEELYNNTTVTWTEQNGVIGSLFTAANGNSLFLPAVGYLSDSYLSGAGSYGYYWSSSLTYDSAQDFYISSDNTFVSNSIRCCGMNVRAVRSAAKH